MTMAIICLILFLLLIFIFFNLSFEDDLHFIISTGCFLIFELFLLSAAACFIDYSMKEPYCTCAKPILCCQATHEHVCMTCGNPVEIENSCEEEMQTNITNIYNQCDCKNISENNVAKTSNYCNSCGEKYKEEDKFCSNCGTKKE